MSSKSNPTTAKKLKVRQIKSVAGRDSRVRSVLAALGLGRIGKSVELPNNNAVLGMINKVGYLLKVE